MGAAIAGGDEASKPLLAEDNFEETQQQSRMQNNEDQIMQRDKAINSASWIRIGKPQRREARAREALLVDDKGRAALPTSLEEAIAATPAAPSGGRLRPAR